MLKRTVISGLATAALASATVLLAGPAHAVAGQEDCTLTDILPQQAVIGIEAERVQFGVKTTCDDENIKFAVRGAGVGTSAHAFWFAACNYAMRQGPTNYDCSHEGSGIINPIGGSSRGYDHIPGNDLAGDNPIYGFAFVDTNGNNLDDDGSPQSDLSEKIRLLRETRFDGSFDASPEPVRKGRQIKVSADLATADWNEGVWAGVDAKVKVQFRADGEKSYRTVKTVKATDGHLQVKVTATRSGSWRAQYAGSDTTAASTSNTDHVKVKRGR